MAAGVTICPSNEIYATIDQMIRSHSQDWKTDLGRNAVGSRDHYLARERLQLASLLIDAPPAEARFYRFRRQAARPIRNRAAPHRCIPDAGTALEGPR